MFRKTSFKMLISTTYLKIIEIDEVAVLVNNNNTPLRLFLPVDRILFHEEVENLPLISSYAQTRSPYTLRILSAACSSILPL